jgi:hypothetical protein
MGLWLILLLILGPLAGLFALVLVAIIGVFFWLWATPRGPVPKGGFAGVADEINVREDVQPMEPDVPNVRPPWEQPRRPRVVKPPVFAAAEPFAIKTCPIAGDRQEKMLPSAVRELTVGGGGRFVFLTLPRENQIAVSTSTSASRQVSATR